MIVVVMGVPGAGKTTVIKGAQKYVSFTYVNYGDIFLEVARERYGIRSRDEIRRKLSWEEYKELHKEAAKRIAEMGKKGLVVLDTHALVALPTGFMPGFPRFVLEILPVSAWVLVEASPEEIAGRRARDAEERERGGGLEEEIALHQELNRVAAIVYATLAGGSVYIVRNKEGRAEEASKELAEVLKGCGK